jgi:uncharacterized protein
MTTTTTRIEQDNIALIRRGYEAFGAGDMATLTTLFAPDARWRMAAVGILTGDYTGREAIFGYFAQLQREAGGTFRVQPEAMAASGDRVFVQETITAQRNGRTLEDNDVLVFTIANGQVREVRQFAGNHPAAAQFWA